MKRVLGWLKATLEDVRIIGANSLEQIFTWIDASYAVHMNIQGHTGRAILMGYGVIHAKAGKQKLIQNVLRSQSWLELQNISHKICGY